MLQRRYTKCWGGMVVAVWKYGFCYFPVPKVANTSIKHALHEIVDERSFWEDPKSKDGSETIHNRYKTPHFREEFRTEFRTLVKVAVVRDPIERAISVYRNRVVHYGELSSEKSSPGSDSSGLPRDPDLDTFFDNFEAYRTQSPSVKKHSDPMTRFLGTDPRLFNYIFNMRELDRLEAFLFAVTGASVTLRKLQIGGPTIETAALHPRHVDFLRSFYQQDYELFGEFIGGRPAGVQRKVIKPVRKPKEPVKTGEPLEVAPAALPKQGAVRRIISLLARR